MSFFNDNHSEYIAPLSRHTELIDHYASHGQTCVTYKKTNRHKPRLGGQCRCCGAGPMVEQFDASPILVANICDSDGVFYSQLCADCYCMVADENSRRETSNRDRQAHILSELLGDDIDGMQAMMDDNELIDEISELSE